MDEGSASVTARRVAAHRLDYDRLQAHGLLAGTGWQVTEGRGLLRSAGLLLARAADPAPVYPERKRPTRRQPRRGGYPDGS
jgi:hypothetical protein